MSLHYSDATVTLHHGDCLDVLRELPDCSVDAVVTDPPYGLANTDPAQVADTITRWVNGERDYLPGGAGFMGKAWDAFVPPVAVWDDCLRVLKPGGHVLAFAGSRTMDLMTLSLRLAGFDIRDSIAWLYGSGFPKSLDVSKAIDARAKVNDETKRRIALVGEVIRSHREAKGMERAEVSRAVVGTPSGACWNWEHQQLPSVEMWPAIKRVLDIPEDFDGLIEGDRAQFIAAERAVLAQRDVPVGHAFAGSTYGGDSSSKVTEITAPATPAAQQWQGWGTALKPAFEPVVVARKPLTGTVAANVLQHGTGALNIDGCRVATEDPLGREWTANMGGAFAFNGFSTKAELEAAAAVDGRTPNGRSARATLEKVNRRTTPQEAPTGRWPANVVLDEAQAERFAESRFFYVAKAPTKERPKVDGVAHPTVKPLALMRWLVRLVTPPGGTVLEPFAGSGTTVEAAVLEGFRCVAIEREPDYLPLIQARLNRAASSAPQPEPVGDSLFDLEEPA